MGCKVGTEGKNFWTEYFQIQKGFRKSFFNKKEWAFLNGGFREEFEKGFSGSENYFLSAENANEKYITVSRPENRNANFKFRVDADYKKSSFENEKTYLFKRLSIFREMPVFGFADFLNSLFSFINSKDRKGILEKSNIFSYICIYYECRIETKELNLMIHLFPGMKLKVYDSAHYSSAKKMTERILLNTEMIHNGIVFAVFSINENGFHLSLKDSSVKYLKTGLLQFNSNMQVSIFGMNISMNGLRYKIEYRQNDKKESFVSGRYEKTEPEIKTAGSLLSHTVDILIPGNIEGYFRMYFRQSMFGNSKKGNNFEARTELKNGRMNLFLNSESEIPRNPFRFLSGRETEKNAPVFMEGLEAAIIKDL